MIAAAGPTSAGSFEVILSGKDESDIVSLFMRSVNCHLKRMTFLATLSNQALCLT